MIPSKHICSHGWEAVRGQPPFSSCSWVCTARRGAEENAISGDSGPCSVDTGQPCHQLKAGLVLAAWSLRIAALSHQPGGPTAGSSVSWPETAASRAALRQRCHQVPRHTPGLSPVCPRFRPRAVNPRAPRASLGATPQTDSEPEKRPGYRYSLFSGDTNQIHQRQRHREVWVAPGPSPRRAGGTTHPRDVWTGLYIDQNAISVSRLVQVTGQADLTRSALLAWPPSLSTSSAQALQGPSGGTETLVSPGKYQSVQSLSRV